MMFIIRLCYCFCDQIGWFFYKDFEIVDYDSNFFVKIMLKNCWYSGLEVCFFWLVNQKFKFNIYYMCLFIKYFMYGWYRYIKMKS